MYRVLKPPKALAVITKNISSLVRSGRRKRKCPEPYMSLEASQLLAVIAAVPSMPCTVWDAPLQWCHTAQ